MKKINVIKLISEQKSTEIKLNNLVIKRTNNLETALEEKEILLKELNHRAKQYANHNFFN